jgi:Flp pilus assembly protein TadG
MGVKLNRREEGAALVETALVVPVILLLLFAIFEMGLAFARYQVLSNASREVARIASLFDRDCATAGPGNLTGTKSDLIAQAVDNYDNALGMDGGITGATTIPNVCVSGQSSEVTLTFVHQLPVLDSFIDQASIVLTARTIMRNE